MTFVGNPQRLRVELVERFDECTKLSCLFLVAELEGLNGTSNNLPGGYAERTRLGVERSPLVG